MKRIRCSTLPDYTDCARRAAVKLFKNDIKAAGFELRQTRTGAAAAVGTGFHKAAETLLRHKMETGELASLADATKTGIKAFNDATPDGPEWDAKTPDVATAGAQIILLTSAFYPVAQAINPVALEVELTADAGDGYELTGHIDLIAQVETGVSVDDFKTGKPGRPYHAQLGGYSLLARSHGYQVVNAGIYNIPRGPIKKPQVAPDYQSYDVDITERTAAAVLERIKLDHAAFKQSGNEYVFSANPSSMLCSERYCPAWGTNFCRLHK